MIKRFLTTVLLMSLLFVEAEIGATAQTFRDFSQKASDYAPLENLRFASNGIEYSGPEGVEIFGRSYPAQKYHLTVPVKVETFEALGPGPTSTALYEEVPANFQIFVVEDTDRAIHDELVEEMYKTWKRKALFSGDYFFDFHISNRDYVLTAVADVKSFYFFWVNGHAVKIVFAGFEGVKGGLGAISSFMADCLRIAVNNIEFRAYQYPLRPQKKFVELYEKGFFTSLSPHPILR